MRQTYLRWWSVLALWPLLTMPLCAAVPVTYRTVSDWSGGFNGEILITNDSNVAIENWTLEFEWDRTLDTIWNARLMDHTGNRYALGPQNWNRSIPPGGKVAIGLSGSPGDVTAGPTRFNLRAAEGPAAPAVPPAAPVKVTLTVAAADAEGFAASILIENRGEQAIEGWTLTLPLEATVNSVWNAGFSRSGSAYTFRPGEVSASIPAGGAVVFGFSASGTAPTETLPGCRFNDGPCDGAAAGGSNPQTPPVTVIPPLVLPQPVEGAIVISNIDAPREATQLTVTPGEARFSLSAKTADPRFAVSSNDARVFTAQVVDGATLVVKALAPGRACLRIQELAGNSVRYIGIRVKNASGFTPILPGYLATGSVSEDTPEHLDFWRAFQDGDRNRRVDIRYIYLNGGPRQGWNTWTPAEGGRAIQYIRNSRMLGMIPFFVFYNIPEAAENAGIASSNSRSASYMAAYFRNLGLLLDIINRESPDDTVGILLEPDFLAYLAQSAGQPASAIPAATRTAYETGVLAESTDERFPDTVRGLVQAVNRTIASRCRQCYFGWHVNLWASPAGGWRTPIPAKGIVRLTDTGDFASGRARLISEAGAIAGFYLEAGVASHGARFVSVDKYGFDAVGQEPQAATDPNGSTWFWNADHWSNYLAFVRTLHDTTGLPVVLWQLPVGRINTSQAANPYSQSGRFADLSNTAQRYEDSAPSYFFGDRFVVNTPPRRDFFSSNRAGDPRIAASGNTITWGSHMAAAAQAGVTAILFGAGIGASTTNIGAPPTDDFWWITRAQQYRADPAPVSTGR